MVSKNKNATINTSVDEMVEFEYAFEVCLFFNTVFNVYKTIRLPSIKNTSQFPFFSSLVLINFLISIFSITEYPLVYKRTALHLIVKLRMLSRSVN